ncbi:protein of unknown function [Xenorhabdus nematophila AN6/1]|nr:protein of unknown function [Xenorhabdus nematophila AN6/1]
MPFLSSLYIERIALFIGILRWVAPLLVRFTLTLLNAYRTPRSKQQKTR